MLSALIIGVTKEITGHVSRLCAETGDACVYKTLESYPHLHEVVRLVNAYAPDVVFLQLAAYGAEEKIPVEHVRKVVEEVRMTRPETSIVGLLPDHRPEGIRFATELGVTELLMERYHFDDFRDVVFRGLDRSAGLTKCQVYSFLPAKSGSGATVTALNVAESLARDYDRRVLLLEADIASGPVAIMLNIQPEQSVVDALDHSERLTGEWWDRIVTKVSGLDVLAASGAQSVTGASEFSYFRLLSFAQKRYDYVIVDFPGVISEPAEPLLSRSKTIFVVCEPELTSLALTRRRIHQLELRGERDSTLAVVVNRYDQATCTKEEMEMAVGHSIVERLPNDYHAVQTAVASGGFVDPATRLGKAYTAFAGRLDGHPSTHATPFARLKSMFSKSRLADEALARR